MGEKILVIEDEKWLRLNTVDLLDLEGFETCSASDGREGIEKAAAEIPDLVLCDIIMPNMDGYEVIQAFRKTPGCEVTPFLFLTGKAEQTVMRKAMNLGADDYVTKPVSREDLLAAIRARLGKHAATKQHFERRLEELRNNIARAIPQELLTPLNGILGLSEVLAEDAETIEADSVAKMARDIHTSGQRLCKLVGRYLLYAELEILAADPARRRGLRDARVKEPDRNLREAAETSAWAAGRLADLELCLESVTVAIEESYFNFIAQELVDNALKFSSAFSPVRVRGRRSGASYVVSVSNHGTGMSPEQVARIGAYTQFGHKLWQQQGSGLGLAIVRLLANLHGGKLRVASKPGETTTVEVELPTADTGAAKPEQAAMPAPDKENPHGTGNPQSRRAS